MARQPSGKDAPSDDVKDVKEDELPDDELDQGEVDELDQGEVDEDDEIEDDVSSTATRSAQADAMWSDVRIQPVEIALPKGVGYTLRAYRLTTELTPTEVVEEEDDFAILKRPGQDALDDHAEFDDDFVEDEEVDKRGRARDGSRRRADEDDDEVDSDAVDVSKGSDAAEGPDGPGEEYGEHEPDEEEEEAEEAAEAEPEEVPAFLSHQGRLLLFRSEEELVDFVKSDVEHDLTQLDTWESLKTRITPSSVVPADEDRYELDLVVENLRGGHDAWDADLLIAAGEVARDLAYALRIEPVRTALAPGSPLDDLDEALRSAANGGVGGFFARRRLKKIAAQQAALAWRTIIGKISAAVDWRD